MRVKLGILVFYIFYVGLVRAQEPPIEVQTPKITSIESAQPDSNNVWLLFELDKTRLISYSIKTQKDSLNSKVSKNQSEIQAVITKAQSICNEQNKSLSVMIKGDSDMGMQNSNH